MAAGGDKGLSEDFYIAQMHQRYQLAKWIVVPVPCIAALWIPLQAALPIAEALAGKDTDVNGTLSVSIVISLGSLAGWLASLIRSRGRTSELQRLRGRAEVLEKELDRGRGE